MTTTVLAYIPSPSQGVWHIGVVPIRAYALFIIAGIIAALVIGDRRWVARGGESGVIYDIALWAVPFGLIGGRLYHVMTDWRTYFGEDGAGLAGAFRIWDGGLGIWGAVALGGLGAWIGCRSKGIPLSAFGDAIAPGIILAQAIGRLGNYFNQELYGRPTTLPWGLEIYERRNAQGVLDSLNGVSTGQPVEIVHPTFLYELLWNLLVFAVLIWIDRRFKVGHGRLFAMYVAGYCLGRFWIELMRSDVATHIAGIRINSFTSTFVFVGAVVYIMVAPKGREDPASLRGKPKEPEEDTAVEEFVRELTTVGATTGVVAAAKAAGAVEDEDAKAVGDESENESGGATTAEDLSPDVPETPSEDIEEGEVAAEADELGADVAGVLAENVAEAEEFAAEGDEEDEPESEAAAEAEALAEDVEKAPAEDIEEAEEFAEAGEDAEPEAGVGAIEPEEAAEAQAAAPEAHEAAVEAAEEAEEVAEEEAEEVADEADDYETEDVLAGPQAEADESASAEDAEPVAGMGAVEGEEAAEAEAAAPEVHEAAVEAADEVEELADEVTEDAVDEPETEDAEAAVQEAAETEPSDKDAEAVAAEADSAVDDEPSTGVLAAETETEHAPATAEPATESRGRLRRWLGRNR